MRLVNCSRVVFLGISTIMLAGASAWGGERAVEKWVARYDRDSDYATAMAIDDSCNVYVSGMSWGPSDCCCVTIKYDSDGNELWAAWYAASGETPVIAVDDSCNVYVATTMFGDYATIKYDANGTEVWVARYDGPGNGTDHPLAIAVDGWGNVYVTGESWGSGTWFDYATIKYGPDSNEPVWVARYNGTANGVDTPYAITIDDSGSVFVTGQSGPLLGHNDYATVKYDSNGKEVWVATYNGPANDDDSATAIALDDSGNVYVTGGSCGTGTYEDYVTIKYGPDSNAPVWVARYNGPGNSTDWATAITVDDSGNVYVTGGSTGAGADWDYATIKYSSDSNEPLWVARYEGPGNSTDWARAMALDNSGNVYVTGDSRGSDTDEDCATIKYGPDSNAPVWIARYNGPAKRT